MQKSYGIYRSYDLQLLEGQNLSGEWVLPDEFVFTSICEDINSESISTIFDESNKLERFRQLIDSADSWDLDSLLSGAFEINRPNPNDIPEGLSIMSSMVRNPFMISPGYRHLEPSMKLGIRSLDHSERGYEMRLQPYLKQSGILVPRKSRDSEICDLFARLLSGIDISDCQPRKICAYLSKNGLSIELDELEAHAQDVCFAFQGFIEGLIGFSTKEYVNCLGEPVKYSASEGDCVGILYSR